MNNETLNRAKELVSQMTLEEKMSQMLHHSPAIERLGIPKYCWWNEALHGVARTGDSTMFPQAIGLGATFDEELIHDIADVISTEGRAKYNEFVKHEERDIYKGLTYWAPNINIFRDPRWGRGHETYGEDPYLTGQLGMAFVKGLQGDDPDNPKAAACAKHYAVHSGPEGDRHHFDAKVSDQDLYDTYLYAFKRLVKDAKVEAVMGAYNRINGEPACGSKRMLKDILRGQWGFEGHVVSDCWAIRDFHENHKVTGCEVESAALAVNNGCDLNCGCTYEKLIYAYKAGLVKEETIDEAVTRLMEIRLRLGTIPERKSKYDDIPYEVVECKEHIELALDAAKDSFVLLKNDGLLPLNKKDYKSIAVIGPNSDSRRALIGNYEGLSSEYITVLEGIRQVVGDDIRLFHAEGTHLWKDRIHVISEPKDGFAEAKIVAEHSDLVVMCLGLDASIEGEEGDEGNQFGSGDKPGLKLTGCQQELLEEIAKIGKPVVLLVLSGSALDLSWAQESNNVNAIMQCWYPGARGGRAIAEVLFGKASPGGKMPLTFYASDDDLPDFSDYSMENRTYRYFKGTPLYPFGYGLGYSKIDYLFASIDKDKGAIGDTFKLKVDVKNTGKYTQHEAVQVYVTDLEASTRVPIRSLRKVKCLELEPGETKEVEFTLFARDFAIIDEKGKCIIEPGKFKISIGGQQPDDRSKELMGRECDIFEIELTGSVTEVEY
ncbi:beta-glucosidase [Pseudobutyrivibrio sp. NOR37]|uniref:Glycoside hydrolase family 3 protein n=1 Tax=Pseudobutyrivibrio xylanivorans TaxID=185007 RepID=A0A6M0LEB0_PSEXY|nr:MULTISPECIES: glycoside hydrolase family 3 C-terminal domain-containing protein [Pseudobutyrivibrio]NEX00958.1 glycoside hydrolase family 3 protein [Pseudobutyrivibrio xylanivorans]SFR63981.1 beta-glucosidase [Pseudobutyrivibrio sp. NOR37]